MRTYMVPVGRRLKAHPSCLSATWDHSMAGDEAFSKDKYTMGPELTRASPVGV